MWEYRATPVNLVDGDTFDAVTDLGFGIGMEMRLRLLGVDAWEDSGATKAKGEAATAFTQQWIINNADPDGRVLITTVKDRRDQDKHDSFGRYLAVVWNMAKTANLNEALITGGHTTGRYQ